MNSFHGSGVRNVGLIAWRSGVQGKAAAIGRDGRAFHGLSRSPEVAVVDVPVATLMRRPPLPHIKDAPIDSVVEPTSGAASGFAFERADGEVDGSSDDGECGRTEENGKLVLMVDVLIGKVGTARGHAPTVASLDEGVVLERARRVIPGEHEVCELTVVQSANLNVRLMRAPKVATLRRGDANRTRLAPNRIRYVAVDYRCFALGDGTTVRTGRVSDSE